MSKRNEEPKTLLQLQVKLKNTSNPVTRSVLKKIIANKRVFSVPYGKENNE
jgi:hypothetical protein